MGEPEQRILDVNRRYHDAVAGEYDEAVKRFAAILLAMSFVVLSMVYALNRKVWAVWPWK